MKQLPNRQLRKILGGGVCPIFDVGCIGSELGKKTIDFIGKKLKK